MSHGRHQCGGHSGSLLLRTGIKKLSQLIVMVPHKQYTFVPLALASNVQNKNGVVQN